MRIGYVVDHPKRDLPGGVMVAHALATRGVETVLIPLYEQAVDVPLLALDALVVNFARPANLELVRAYSAMGIPVWVIDTEGGVLADDGANTPDRLAAYIRESGFAELLAGYFFWGSTLHEAFVQGSGMPADRLHLSGCPRFDYAAPRWRSLLEYDRDDYVLVNANFPLVNPLFAKSPEAEVGSLVAAGWDRPYVEQLLSESRQILRNYLDTVLRLALRFPQTPFLVRPHPFENDALYRREFAAAPNVVVEGRGSVLNVIHHARGVLHLNCGTAIESLLLDKLPLSMDFLNTPFMSRHSSLPSRVSQGVATEAQLERFLDDLPAATRDFDFEGRHRALVRPWFHANDGAAADRIAEALLAALRAGPGRKPRSSVLRSLASSRPNPRAGQRAQALAANVAGSRWTASLRDRLQPTRRAKRLEPDLVRKLLGAICRHERIDCWPVGHARHPLTRLPLASIRIGPHRPVRGSRSLADGPGRPAPISSADPR